MAVNVIPDEWGVKQLDLEAYLGRIGQPCLCRAQPTEETLRRLHRAHVETIPFENIDIVLGRGVPTSMDAIQNKLVGAPRGGYCHEHGLLFGAALERLGFNVVRLLARPRERPGRPWPNTHLTLVASGRDGEWLADVGFGAGLLEPLRMPCSVARGQGTWSFSLAPHEEGYQLVERLGGSDNLLYSFSVRPQRAADIDAANYYTSTHADSPFTGQLVVMQRLSGEVRRLLNREFSRGMPDGSSTKTRGIDDEALERILREEFGIIITPREAEELAAKVDTTRSTLVGGP